MPPAVGREYLCMTGEVPKIRPRRQGADATDRLLHERLARYMTAFEAVKAEAQGLYQVNYEAMIEADQKAEGQPVPRFLGLPDNRDFFYLTRREGGVS